MTPETHKTGTDTYAETHRHPMNRVLHAVGIPVIASCAIAAIVGPTVLRVPRRTAVVGLIVGSGLLVLGHAIEGNRPAIFTRRGAALDAVRWWAAGAGRLVTRIFR